MTFFQRMRILWWQLQHSSHAHGKPRCSSTMMLSEQTAPWIRQSWCTCGFCAARGHDGNSSPGPGLKASVHTPAPAELGRKWLEALSLRVNCLLSKSLVFLEKGGSVPKNYLARLKWTAARLLAVWGFFRQEGFKHCCSESGRTLFRAALNTVWRWTPIRSGSCCLIQEQVTPH